MCFQLFSETRNAFYDSNGLRKLVPLCGSPTVKLQSPERLFGLDEEIDRPLPHVRSLHLIREERYGGWLKCIAL